MICLRRKAFLALISFVLLASCMSCNKSNETIIKQSDPLGTFDDMKFGMFIHWGLYAVPAGEWKGEEVRGIGEWIMHRKEIPVEEYAQLAQQFNPTEFRPDQWAQLAKDAGMKYMVITSKHHDGFSMFDSEVSDYDIVDATPYATDPMVGLADACKEEGIRFGFYYSQDQDWHEPNARGNSWDFTGERDAQQYIQKKAIPQIHEILTNYGELALIWFDTPGLLTKEQALELRKTVKALQPNCLINSRIGHDQHDYFQTGDNAIPIQVLTKEKWEVPATLNDTWGFKTNDDNWKDPKDLVCKLSDIVSKGGNYLLNVGPTAEGIIPQESQDILRSVGTWLEVNGEAIFETDPSPFYFPDVTWRCTTRPGKLYLHILNWPGKRFTFKGLANKVKKARFLANDEMIPFKQDKHSVQFTLPEEPVDDFCSIIVLELEEEEVLVAEGFESGAPKETMDLYAWSARLRGEELKYDWDSKSVSNFVHAEFIPNELWWYLYGAITPGSYQVEISYACDQGATNDTVTVETTLNGWKVDQEINFVLQDTKGEILTRRFETPLKIVAENKEIRLGFKHPANASSVRIQKITLFKND